MLGELDSLHVAEDARAPLFPVPGISSCMEVPAMDLVGRGGGAWKSPPQDHAFFQDMGTVLVLVGQCLWDLVGGFDQIIGDHCS